MNVPMPLFCYTLALKDGEQQYINRNFPVLLH